jgi:hypothetical protein
MTGEPTNPPRDLRALDDDAVTASPTYVDTDEVADDGDKKADQLVSEIDETRARMTDTVQAIGQKLDPHNVVQQATDTVREATIGRVEHMASNTGEAVQQTGGSIVDTIRNNPIPAAMTAVGLYMLWKNRSHGNGNREWAHGRYAGPTTRPDLYGRDAYGVADGGAWQRSRERGAFDRARETATDAADSVGQTVSGAASSVGQTLSGAADSARQTATDVTGTASQVPERAGEVAERATSEFSRILEENPLAVGAIALAAGAAAGLVLPTTQPERRYLGEARDKVVERAESAAHQALDKVEEEQATNA